MELGKFKAREVPPTVLRLHPDLRDELIRVAEKNNRSLTKEISARLQVSLSAQGPTLQGILSREAFGKPDATPAPGIAPGTITPDGRYTNHTVTAHIAESTHANGPAASLSELDRAMLGVFHALPVEKQLALLSLFK